MKKTFSIFERRLYQSLDLASGISMGEYKSDREREREKGVEGAARRNFHNSRFRHLVTRDVAQRSMQEET